MEALPNQNPSDPSSRDDDKDHNHDDNQLASSLLEQDNDTAVDNLEARGDAFERLSDVIDLRAPYGTRPAPAMEGALLQSLLSDFPGADLSSWKRKLPSTADAATALPTIELDIPSANDAGTGDAEQPKEPALTRSEVPSSSSPALPMGGLAASMPMRTRSNSLRKGSTTTSLETVTDNDDDNQPQLRGSFLDTLRREGLTTIDSGRELRSSRSSHDAKPTKASHQDHEHDSLPPPTLLSSLPSRLPSRPDPLPSAPKRTGLTSVSCHQQGTSARRSSFLKSKLRNVGLKKTRFANQGKAMSRSDLNYVDEPAEPIKAASVRRYSPGESVLINNHSLGWVRLVNKHGFPPGSGESIEERKGPYRFVLATVKEVHFDEVQPYYTVVVIHSQEEERADAQYMHPLLTRQGEEAAMLAATSAIDHPELHDEHGTAGQVDREDEMRFSDYVTYYWLSTLYPFVWMYEGCEHVGRKHVVPIASSVLEVVRAQGSLVLNGKSPYSCPLRFTIVNFFVLCSTWYVFMDMIRLAFAPPGMDGAIAIVDFFVWIVLMLELLFQVFIRPDGFSELILTDKAYSPTTIRYINWFHLYVELLSLLLYIPEFDCVFSSTIDCSEAIAFSFHQAVLIGTVGPTRLQTFYGHAYIALVRLRVFGLIRHWRNMWITNTFIKMKWAGEHTEGLRALIPLKSTDKSNEKKALLAKKETPEQVEQRRKDEVLTSASTIGTALMATNSYRALGLYWCIFGLFPVIFCISSTFVNPLGSQMTDLLERTNVMANDNATETCQFLSGSVWAWITSVAPPIGFRHGEHTHDDDPYLMTVEILPARCSFQDGTETLRKYCQTIEAGDGFERNISGWSWSMDRVESFRNLCDAWRLTWNAEITPAGLATATNKRQGSILFYSAEQPSNLTLYSSGGIVQVNNETFSVTASFDATRSIELAASSCLLAQICLLFGILGGLSVLRRDAEVLVLNPLRGMLRKVAQYAKNPLAQPRTRARQTSGRYSSGKHQSRSRSNESISSSSSDSESDGERELGSFETQQLITAVNKITDLLRKCWGVAGAGIISTNLAAREGALEVFNPTVPGKSVYALFGFAYINDFDHILMSLQDDVMVLINEVAQVLHEEVYRWGFGDSGQCNKNLGAAFLMVFRIGLVKEVIDKLEQATDVIFSTTKGTNTQGTASNRARRTNHQRTASQSSSRVLDSSRSIGSSSRDDLSSGSSHLRVTKRTRALKKKMKEIDPKTLSLQSLPGISTFTDRAVIGMLKAFAGIHRDNKIRNWNNDFRLSAGVGAFEVSMIFGMDAGWAVEGAVGSEYKIDATYLSPHVNMASRMMMASKQYGVKIMLSQSVQELMSDVANTKLRHLDTVTVKGSSVKQRIYTYDARAQGVDFFLFSRTDEQADYDAEKYTPRIWDTDQDLLSMRQHVSEKFLSVYNKGHKAYIQGDWEKALPLLERANEIMVETALEEGYLEDQFEALQMQSGDDAKAAEEELKRLNGDGPSLYLVAFMKSLGGKAPDDWEGWHPLTRK